MSAAAMTNNATLMLFISFTVCWSGFLFSIGLKFYNRQRYIFFDFDLIHDLDILRKILAGINENRETMVSTEFSTVMRKKSQKGRKWLTRSPSGG